MTVGVSNQKRFFRKVLLCWFVLLSFFPATPAAAAAETQLSREYPLKAAFLYNFVKFVDWAPERFSASNSPIVVAVLGKNPFGRELETLVKGRAVGGREIVVKNLTSTNDLAMAHVAFVSAGQELSFGSALEPSPEKGILTIGETPQATNLGAMITFVMEGDKVRFEIDTASADLAGIKISAQLLKLARSVHKKR
jgi:hypothetical protein